MAKQCLHWKRVRCRNVQNQDFESSLPVLVSQMYKGRLLFEILNMPRKSRISFDEAIRLATAKRIDAIGRHAIEEYVKYHENFIQFISDSGYHIELTGDEFVFHLSKDLEI